ADRQGADPEASLDEAAALVDGWCDQAWAIRGFAEMVRGMRLDRPEPCYRSARRWFLEGGSARLVAHAEVLLSTALMTAWRFDGAAAVARRCEPVMRSAGYRRQAMIVRFVRSSILLHRGKLRQAQVDELTAGIRPFGDAGLELAVRLLEVELAVVQGRWDDA